MLLHQCLGDGQAESCTFAHASGGLADLVELVEDRLVLILGDTDPAVGDCNLDEAIPAHRIDADLASLRG